MGMSLRSAFLSGLGATLFALTAVPAPAWPTDSRHPSSAAVPDTVATHIEFNLPAQPLAQALRRYASLTGEPTLYPSELVQDRTSAPVHGRYSSETALHLLLEGTGLMAEKADAGPRSGYVLTTAPSAAIAPRAGLGDLTGYPGRLQAQVWEALCAAPVTAPGNYRALLRFQVDALGRIQQPRLLATTGDTRRDTAVLAVLQRVQVGGPPPPGLPQPVTMLVVPRDEGSADAPYCNSEAA